VVNEVRQADWRRSIASSGFKSLRDGQKVSFSVTQRLEGLQANEVQPLRGSLT
jgi:cold shock CspA family protein